MAEEQKKMGYIEMTYTCGGCKNKDGDCREAFKDGTCKLIPEDPNP